MGPPEVRRPRRGGGQSQSRGLGDDNNITTEMTTFRLQKALPIEVESFSTDTFPGEKFFRKKRSLKKSENSNRKVLETSLIRVGTGAVEVKVFCY